MARRAQALPRLARCQQRSNKRPSQSSGVISACTPERPPGPTGTSSAPASAEGLRHQGAALLRAPLVHATARGTRRRPQQRGAPGAPGPGAPGSARADQAPPG